MLKVLNKIKWTTYIHSRSWRRFRNFKDFADKTYLSIKPNSTGQTLLKFKLNTSGAFTKYLFTHACIQLTNILTRILRNSPQKFLIFYDCKSIIRSTYSLFNLHLKVLMPRFFFGNCFIQRLIIFLCYDRKN